MIGAGRVGQHLFGRLVGTSPICSDRVLSCHWGIVVAVVVDWEGWDVGQRTEGGLECRLETSVLPAAQVLLDYLRLRKCRPLWSNLGCRF